MAGHTALVILANLARLGAQAIFFVAFARSVGPSGFASFSAAIALAIIMSPFIGLGSGSLIVKNCSREPTKLPSYYGNAAALSAITLVIATPIYIFLLRGSLGPDGLLIAGAVLIAELFATKFQEITTQAFQSQGRIPLVAGSTLISSILRITAGAMGYYLAGDSITDWLLLYLASALIPCMIVTIVFISSYGITWCARLGELGEGLKFSIGISSQGVYNDADKLILPRFVSGESAGNYAAAYKIVDVAFSPIRALLTVTYPGFFKAGQHGIGASLDHARRFLPVTLTLGALGSCGVYLCSEIAPALLGQDYSETTQILKYLAIIPLMRSFHFLIADALTGADHQGTRSVIQVSIAALSIAASFSVIPGYGWRGAAIVSLMGDAILCLALGATALILKRREGKTCD